MTGDGRDAPAWAQRYVERAPAPALRGVVSAVWVQEVPPAAGSYVHRNVADGSVEVVCRVGSLPRVIGPRTRPTVEVLAPGTTIVGLRFLRDAASRVLGVPANDLVDLVVAGDDLWGRVAMDIGERIEASPTPQYAVTVVERLIAMRLVTARGPDPLVAKAVQLLLRGVVDVRSLADELCISERQLRRRCKVEVGVAPKPLQRMLRFQVLQALAQHNLAAGIDPAGEESIGRLAAELGYADQAHLTRECQRLTGQSPRSFLAAMQHSCVGGHDHAASYEPLLRAAASRGALVTPVSLPRGAA